MKPFILFIIALAFAGAAQAQLASLQIDSVSPPGAQAGMTVEVSVNGQDLDELDTLLFNHPGITGEHVDGNRFKVSVAADVPADFYEMRVTGRFGISNPRPFHISSLPQMVESGAHQTLESALPVPFDTFIDGTADADAMDVYKFTASAGQRVFIECVADALDSRMDATLVLYGSSGAELLRDRDSNGRDPFIDFKAPAAGDYFVSVHDFQYQGGANHRYRLLVNTGAHIDYVMPPSGTPGKLERFTVYGRNIPGSQPARACIDGQPLEKKEIEIEVPTEAGRLLSRAIAAVGNRGMAIKVEGAHQPVLLAEAQAPVVLEREPNNAANNAHRVSVPSEIGGQFYPANDSDWYEFDGEKGKVYWVEVFSERNGDATDPFLVVQQITRDGKGEEVRKTVVEGDDIDEKVGGHIFPSKSRDARVTFKAEADALYRVLLHEQFSGVDPRHTYRLVIREAEPEFELLVGAQQFTDEGDQLSRASSFLRRGSSIQLKVMAHRYDGFNGAIEVNVGSLPTGVAAQACTIPAGQKEATLTLTAGPDAPGFAGYLDVSGEAEWKGQKMRRSASGVSLLWGVGNWKQQFTRARVHTGIALAVSAAEPAPVVLQPAEDKVYETSLAGKLEIPLQVAKRDGIKGKATIQPIALPGLKKASTVQIDNNAKEAKLVLDLAKKDGNEFKPGEYTIFAQAKGIVHYRANPEAQERAEALKKEKDAATAALEAEVKQAETAGDDSSEKKKKLEAARKEQADADAKLKAATERAKPQERRFHSVSQPMRIRILSAPVKLSQLEPQTIKPESKSEVAVSVDRLFGFAEEVGISVGIPENVKGLQVQPITIAKDAGGGTLEISASNEATHGDHQLSITAKVKWNGEELTVSRPLKIRIEE